ncbi:MAG: riboflavin biosynthesis protein RibD, partial [Muribaculaceae bacterium]|nr:riboflavin biosynthesis protein RibD [Muribaculaceae bacterium]
MIEVDERFMRRALELAAHGRGNTSPNPMVGAVIVSDDGRIIGEGYHRRCGEAHAEVNAVASVKDVAELKRSTMYVTLEPCSHYGKTP